jgi:NADPH:quinone reductase
MSALRFAHFGDPLDVLWLDDVATPEPSPGEVRVRVTHRPINPALVKLSMTRFLARCIERTLSHKA